MKSPFLLLTFCLIPVLHADLADEARVDLIGEADQIEIDVTETSPGAKAIRAGWRHEMAPFHINATFPITRRWEPISITFVPRSSGKVILSLAGPNITGGETVWIGYDQVEVEGATLDNGSFEDIADSGRPARWYMPPSTSSENAEIRSGNAAEGKNYARVWHGSRFQQVLQVEEGQPVTLTLQARLLED